MSHSHGQSQAAQPSPESISRGHEVTDAKADDILIFLISLSITIAVVVLISIGLFVLFQANEDKATEAEYANSPLTQDRPGSPAPPLQPSIEHEFLPYEDSAALKAIYDRLSGTYGKDVMADHESHQRMPVQAAMKMLEEQGLPHDTATDIPSPQGTSPSVPTPSGDGGRGSNTGTAAAPGIPQK